MAIKSEASARFVRIAPRKARVIVNLVRGNAVGKALDALHHTTKSAAPIVKDLIESAIANAKLRDPRVNVDELFIETATVDKGPNKHMRRWRPRAMGRATQVTKGTSHIRVVLSDTPRESPKPQASKVAVKSATTSPDQGSQG